MRIAGISVMAILLFVIPNTSSGEKKFGIEGKRAVPRKYSYALKTWAFLHSLCIVHRYSELFETAVVGSRETKVLSRGSN